jgi:hypothetical protein
VVSAMRFSASALRDATGAAVKLPFHAGEWHSSIRNTTHNQLI